MGQVAWITTMDEALAKAKAEKKPILIDFFQSELNRLPADGCGHVSR